MSQSTKKTPLILQLPNLQARAAGLVNSNTSAKSEEARRVAQTLREIDEDRDLVKRRVERERIVREAREKAAKEEEAKKTATEGTSDPAIRAPIYAGGMDGGAGRGALKGGRRLDGDIEGDEGDEDLADEEEDEDEGEGFDEDEEGDEDDANEGDERPLRQRRPHGTSAYSGEGRRLGGAEEDVTVNQESEVKTE